MVYLLIGEKEVDLLQIKNKKYQQNKYESRKKKDENK
jgi:hypothetical protein